MSKVTPFIMGRNNTIGKAQRASLVAFLASTPGRSWLATVAISERQMVARSGWSALGERGRVIDEAFCAAWDRWTATLPVAPAKSHKWSKGACVIALGC